MEAQQSDLEARETEVPAFSGRWYCSACGAEHEGLVEVSLDPRWVFARCRACRKRVVMARVPVRCPAGEPRPSATSQATSARSGLRNRRS
jgi:hypothetical protein